MFSAGCANHRESWFAWNVGYSPTEASSVVLFLVPSLLIHLLMSLTARLHIAGHSLERQGIRINALDFSFSQEVDNYGAVTSRVRAGQINLTLPGIEDAEVISWMAGRNIYKSGKIVFSGVLDTGKKRSIEFTDAACVYYYESFSDQSDVVVKLALSARKIKFSGMDYEMDWDSEEKS